LGLSLIVRPECDLEEITFGSPSIIETGFGSLLDLEFLVWSMEEAAEVMNVMYNSRIG